MSIELHWLPVTTRIINKICVLVYQAIHTGRPDYLRSLIQNYDASTNIVVRHATEQYRLKEPRCNTEFGARAFI